MIVVLGTPEERKNTRIKLYKDDVFMITHEAIKERTLTLSIEELFATADKFTSFLLENELSEREVMQYEMDDLKDEVKDEQTFCVLLTLSFVKLSALRKVEANAEGVARALVGFCQEYDDFTKLLIQFSKKEHSRWLDNKRANLLSYELKCIEKEASTSDVQAVVKSIVESAYGLSVEGMQHVENVLSEVNDKFEHRYQKDLDSLREARKKKSVANINIDRVNDIHDNPNVNIGTK